MRRLIRLVQVYLMREQYIAKASALGVGRGRALRTLRDFAEIYPDLPDEMICVHAWCALADDLETDA